MNGYLRVAALMPDIKVANPKFNIESIKEEILKANALSVKICVFPELCITGNNLMSLYHDRNLLNDALEALYNLLAFSNEVDIVIVVSIPFEYKSCVYEVAAVIKSGNILGFVPKNNLDVSNSKMFSILDNDIDEVVLKDNSRNITYSFPFAQNLLFENNRFNFSVIFNSAIDELNNADMLCNIASIPETINVDSDIRNVKDISNKYNLTIITSSPGISESTERNTYFGRSFICECGDIIVKNDILTNHILICDVDLDKKHYKSSNKFNKDKKIVKFTYDNFIFSEINEKLFRDFDKYPYINKKINSYNYSMHIINILSVALAKKLKSCKAENIVIGVSGGIDSTMALLVAKKTAEFLSYTNNNIIAVFMPCFGTSNDSTNNVKNLAQSLSLKLRIIDITKSVTQHFEDIGHDINITNTTYENAQARERTQVLMDIANELNGIVIGTGDLSEIALGFSTYNGDQMSMYNINASLPKTLIRYILNSIADENIRSNNNIILANTLKNILYAKVSPELLPTENGVINQKTEEILGNYEIHDYILYYYLKYNFDYEKIYDLTLRTFVYNNEGETKYTEDYINNCLKIFFNRFYKSQFKRTAAPPAPSIGLPNLDSHNEYYIPSDVEINL